MRERAQRTTAACPWFAWEGDLYWKVDGVPDGPHICNTGRSSWDGTKENAEHIASWHPAVALAVADWLEARARDCDTGGFDDPYGDAVARAYLGEEAG